MVKFSFNVFAYDLERAIRIIRRGLDAAERALHDEEEAVSRQIDDLKLRIENGQHPGYQVDNEFHVIDDPFEFHNYDLETIEETQIEVRKAMLLALYHAWERVARDMTGLKGNESHQVIKEAMIAQGIEQVNELDHLRKTVNLIKHNSEQKMRALWDVRRDLFINGFNPDMHFPHDWNDALRITSNHVTSFIDAVIASGPTQEPRAIT